MYNKKTLLEALKNLNNAKAPAKQKNIPFDPTGKGMLNPLYAGKSVVLPTDTLYNPTPYRIKATSDNGIEKFLNPFDETPVYFPEASSIKEEVYKKGGSKKNSKSLMAKNKLLKKNPLFKKQNSKGKTYDPSAMYFQNGGGIPYDYNPYLSAEEPMEYRPFVNPIITGNEPDDYQQFLDYSRTAPENRRPDENYFYGDPNNYDHYGMWQGLGKPKDFQQALELNPYWEPDPYDNMYHGFSVNPETGVFLKSGKPEFKEGDTTWMEIAGHYLSPRAQMNTPVFDVDLQRFRYIPNKEYKQGGYIVDDISIPDLTKAQTGLFVPQNLSYGTQPGTLEEVLALGKGPIRTNVFPSGKNSTTSNITPTTPKNNTPTIKPNQKVVTSQEEYDKQLKIYLEAKKRNAMMKASAFGNISKLYDLRNEDYTHPVVFDENSKFKTINDYLKNAEKLGLEKTGKSYLSHSGYPLPTFKQVKPYFQEFYDKQQQLIDAGYDIGTVDGIWGPKSKAAWEEFQAQQNAPQQTSPVEVFPDEIQAVENEPILTTPVQEESPKKYAYRSQTVIDPVTRKWTLQQVPYAEYVPGKGWVDLDTPRVIGNESNSGVTPLEGLSFKDGGLVKAQEGNEGVCPPGEELGPDGKCMRVKDLQEVVYYGDDEKRKLQGNLLDKFQQVKGAYQDWREDAGLRRAQLKNEGASSIEGIKKQIADYKKELNEEKKAYSKAESALKNLQKHRPDEWKDAKIKDVLSPQGIEALRSLYSEEKISDQSFRDFYNSFGKDYDVNVIKGTGPDKEYSAKEAKQEWMENVPEFVEHVGNFAKAAAIAPGIITVGPAINSALSYAPIQAAPWLTAGNLLNAHFAYETFKPEGFVEQAYEGFKEGDNWKGAENAAWSALGALPFVKPAVGTARAIKTLKTPGQVGVIPTQGRYSVAYKSPVESGLVVGNPNLAEAAPAFEKFTNPLSRFTKEAGLGEFKILRQNQAVSNVKPNAFLGDMANAGQAVEVTTPTLMGNAPKTLDTQVPLYRVEPQGITFPKDKLSPEYMDWDYGAVSKMSDESINKLLQQPNTFKYTDNRGVERIGNFFPQHTAGNWWSSIPMGQPGAPDYVTAKFAELDNKPISNLVANVPFSKLDNFNVKNDPAALRYAGYPEKEFILPSEYKNAAEAYSPEIYPVGLNNVTKEPELVSQVGTFTDDLTKLSKEDNDIAVSIIDDVRARKLDLWQTPEGQSRLQSMIDNTPSLKGETPTSLLEGIASMENLNTYYANTLKTQEDLLFQLEQADLANAEGYMSNYDYRDLVKNLEEQLAVTKENINTVENTFKDYGAFYYAKDNSIGIKPGAYTEDDLYKITSHELGHIFGSFKKQAGPTYLDKKLEKLKLIDDTSEQLTIPFTDPIKSSAYTRIGQGSGDYLGKSKSYFETGSGGSEKTPMLAEVREDMLQKGIIKSEYAPITTKMIKDHFNNYKKTTGEKYPLRIYDIMKDDPKNFNLLEEVINKLPLLVGAAAGVDAYMDSEDSGVTEAGVAALFAAFLKKPATTKVAKNLKEIFSIYKSGGLEALKPAQIKTLRKEIKSLDKERDLLQSKRGDYGTENFLDPSTLYNMRSKAAQDLANKQRKLEYFIKKPDEINLQSEISKKAKDVDEYNKLMNTYQKTLEGSLNFKEPSIYENIVTTGQQQVTDFSTGQKINAEVTLPSLEQEYKLVDGQLQVIDKTITRPTITPEYVRALKNSKNKVQTDIPGAKVFGSSVLVTEAGMPHITGDIDVLILQSDYQKNVANKYNFVQDYGPAKQHAIYPEYGQEGILDFNIINENANGTVKPIFRQDPITGEQSSLEVELFRQFYPDKFAEASKKAIISGKPIEINMPAKEFMDGINSEVKTVIDAYETSPTSKYGRYKSSKEKHILRPDVLIAFGNPEVVAKGQEAYIKSLVGSKGTIGHQFPKEALENVSNNILALYAMDFKGGNMMAIAQNPERMQLALNDFYINSTGFTREITPDSLPGGKYTEENIMKAMTEWFPGKGGSLKGAGLNTVQLGNPLHTGPGDMGVIGHRQLGIKTNTESPLAYVNSVNRATSGLYTFTPEELETVKDIFKKYAPEVNNQIEQIRRSQDILDIRFNYFGGDGPKAKVALEEIAKTLDIRAIRRDAWSNVGSDYGNSLYASLLDGFDESLDTIMYSLKDLNATPKSLSQRKEKLNILTANKPGLSSQQIKAVEDFKKISSVISNGYIEARNRLISLQDKLQLLQDQKKVIIDKMTIREALALTDIQAEIDAVDKQVDAIWDQKNALGERIKKIESVRQGMLTLGLATAGTVGTYFVIQEIDKMYENKNTIKDAKSSVEATQQDVTTGYLNWLSKGNTGNVEDYLKDTEKKNSESAPRVKMQYGGTPSQIWQQYTGTSWSEAKKQGLTDGSAAQNLALADRLLAGEFGQAKVSYEDYQNSRAQYDQMIVDKVMRGATLDDLIAQRVGTRAGLINRFPDLFNQESPAEPKTLPGKASAKKEVIQKAVPKDTVVQRVTPQVLPQRPAALQSGLPYELMQRAKGNPMTNLSELQRFVQTEEEPIKQQNKPAPRKKVVMEPSGMTEYSKNLLAGRENVSIEELQKRYSKPEPQVTTTPLEFSGLANLKNRPEAVPAFMNQPVSQPIAGGIGSQFSNTGTSGIIDQNKLKTTEQRLADLNKKIKNLPKVVQPSFLEKAMQSQASLMSSGPDVYKGLDEIGDTANTYKEYLKRLAIKKGLSEVEEEKVKVKETKPLKPVAVKDKVDSYYNEIATVADKVSTTKSDSLMSYRNQWDNSKGFEYIATPVKKDRDPNKVYSNVKGVAHFLLDASANPNSPYSHSYNKAFLDKAIANNDWIPTFQTLEGDRVKLQYKKPSEISLEDSVITPLRQMKFSEIRFDKTKKPQGFASGSGIKEVTKNDGEGTYLIFKDRDGYSRFSGGSVVFIFNDKSGNTIVRDFAGSLNQIENEGLTIQKQYNIKPEELTIGYHDVGSFSAKPKADSKGNLKTSQWHGFNPHDWTGGALLIPND